MAVMAALAVPGAAWADAALAVIRIEAKRSAPAAAEAAARWRAEFGNVVTFPLPGGWTAIALGPMDPDTARARIAELKAAKKVPQDSFVAIPPSGVELDTGTPAATPENGAAIPEPPIAAVEETTPDAEAVPEATAEASPPDAASPAPNPPASEVATDSPAAPPQAIVLETFDTVDAAQSALDRWRASVPEAGVWAEGTGAVIAVGPLPEGVASSWATVLEQAKIAPQATVRPAADFGTPVMAGAVPDWPAPPETPAAMPPTEDIQRALRWAGHYDGPIDGKPGPKTQEAITLEMALLRLSPDPGTAMARLIERRADWTAEMGLSRLEDAHTGLAVNAPMDRLVFDRADRALSIYGPKDGSGAALILFAQTGGQQEMLDLTGLVTALGWVPAPERQIAPGRATLRGGNDTHLGQAEAWVRDGRAEGFVLIWPASAPEAADDLRRLSAELADSLTRFGPGTTTD